MSQTPLWYVALHASRCAARVELLLCVRNRGVSERLAKQEREEREGGEEGAVGALKGSVRSKAKT